MVFSNWVLVFFTCSNPQVILARVKVNICGRVQVDRQQKESTCLGRNQVFVSRLFISGARRLYVNMKSNTAETVHMACKNKNKK